MKCKKCLQIKSSEDFSTYYKKNGILCTYHVCKSCYSNSLRLANTGKTHSEETLKKMSLAKKGKKQSPELIEKRASKIRGRKYSQEHIEHVRLGLLGRKLSPEHCANISKGKIGTTYNTEHCLKISASNVGKHNGKRNDEQRMNISLGTKKGMSPLEVRQMCADRQRRLLASNIYKTPKTTELNMKKILVEDLGLIEGKDFKHQHYVKLEHPHVADFFIYKKNIVVECDGDYWHSLPENILKDKLHEKEMNDAGISWIRFTETQLTKKRSEVIKILSEVLS